MAEEEEKEDDKKEGGKSSNMVLIIIIAVLVLVLVIGGIVTFMLSGDDEAQQMDQSSEQMSKSASPKKQKKRMESLTVGPMYPLDNFIVNLLSDSGRRFLKTQINLEMDTEDLAAELDSKVPVIRDIIIRVLTSKTLEEISTAKGKDKLKDALVNQLNMRLQDGEVNNLYFTEFVIQ